MKRLSFLIIVFNICLQLHAQDNDTTKSNWDFTVTADVVSRYVWRGSDYGNSPAVQPDMEVSYKNVSLGSWGSTTISSSPFQEVDLFASYEIWKFKFTCWDYFFMNMDTVNNNYLKYSEEKTGHDFSFDTEFKLSKKVPLKLLVSYNFYGADSLHSSYFELSYELNKKNPLTVFAGYTPEEGWYGNGPGLVNVGLVLLKECKISDKYSMPFFCKIVLNPQRESVYLVAGASF